MSLPFIIDNLYGGFADVHGTLRIHEHTLVLEFKVCDSVLEVFQSEIKEVVVSFDDVETVELKRRWFGLSTRISVRTRTMKALDGVPGTNNCELHVSISRKNLLVAQEFVSQANFKLSESKLKTLRDGASNIRS